MATINDVQAFALASTYGFCPPRIPIPNHTAELDTGKYEPDDHPEADTRFMLLAQPIDATNALFLYNPILNVYTPYHVSNGLDPDSSGDYTPESGFNDELTYVGPDREFFIWWDNINSWIISDHVGRLDGPYWKRTDPSIIGVYAAQAGAVGIAEVEVGPA